MDIRDEIRSALLSMSEPANADFQAKLTPGIEREKFLGVRVPALRAYAKTIRNRPELGDFLSSLPHEYYDENLLHSILLGGMKDFESCMNAVEAFLPYVDNWAVCDTLRPVSFKKHPAELMEKILEWSASKETYTCRFGIDMLMTYFLDEKFSPEQLEIPAGIVSEEYYVNMMLAWYFATALAKQWDAVIPYLESGRLGTWVHNKSIQKARESFRITPEQKEYLKTLRK